MYIYHFHIKRRRTIIELVLGLLLLLCGCAIYLLFRSKTLNIYQWCSALGLSKRIDYLREIAQTWDIPDLVKYSLPDGMYCAAYILIVDAIWHKEHTIYKYVAISLVPIVTIGSELLQSLHLVRGTFDIFDLICYALPPLVYAYIILYQKNSIKEQ